MYYSGGFQTSSPSSSLVAGTICSPEKDLPEKINNELNRRSAQNNKTVQQEDVPQQRELKNVEASLKATNLDLKISVPTNDPPPFNSTGTIDPQQQGETAHHMMGPSNAPVDDISNVSSKSKSAQSKQPHSSTIPTGMNIFMHAFENLSIITFDVHVQKFDEVIS